MIRHLLPLLALAPAVAWAEPEPNLLQQSLDHWARYSQEQLAIAGGPPPNRTVFAAVDLDFYQARAELGVLVAESSHRRRPGRVEVVVGDDTLNSSRYQMTDPGLRVVARPSLVVEDVPLALERDLWLTADHVYKAAVVQYQVKQAALAALGGEPPPPDWSAANPVQFVGPSDFPELDQDTLRSIATEASARFRDYPMLRTGRVEAHAWNGTYHLATSEGTQLAQPEGFAVIYAQANMLRPDGVRLSDQRQWLVRSTADLPSLEQITAEVDAMAQALEARFDAPIVDYYEGPVVFEGNAAADLLRYLLPRELSGTPPEPSPHQTYQQLIRNGPRLGRRLLPQGWSVMDDPARQLPGLVGSYAHDREGVPTRPVELVKDGYVRDLLMSRIPRHDLQQSNGHARGSVQGDWAARLFVWQVTPPRNLGDRAFDRQVARAFKGASQERMLVVRGLGLGRPGSLPRPTDAVWRYADGHEEPVASLQFQRVDRRVLRDILAAGGGTQQRAYLAPWTLRSHADGDSGLPTVLEAPQRLLVAELEAVFPGADERPNAYTMPGLAD